MSFSTIHAHWQILCSIQKSQANTQPSKQIPSIRCVPTYYFQAGKPITGIYSNTSGRVKQFSHKYLTPELIFKYFTALQRDVRTTAVDLIAVAYTAHGLAGALRTHYLTQIDLAALLGVPGHDARAVKTTLGAQLRCAAHMIVHGFITTLPINRTYQVTWRAGGVSPAALQQHSRQLAHQVQFCLDHAQLEVRSRTAPGKLHQRDTFTPQQRGVGWEPGCDAVYASSGAGVTVMGAMNMLTPHEETATAITGPLCELAVNTILAIWSATPSQFPAGPVHFITKLDCLHRAWLVRIEQPAPTAPAAAPQAAPTAIPPNARLLMSRREVEQHGIMDRRAAWLPGTALLPAQRAQIVHQQRGLQAAAAQAEATQYELMKAQMRAEQREAAKHRAAMQGAESDELQAQEQLAAIHPSTSSYSANIKAAAMNAYAESYAATKYDLRSMQEATQRGSRESAVEMKRKLRSGHGWVPHAQLRRKGLSIIAAQHGPRVPLPDELHRADRDIGHRTEPHMSQDDILFARVATSSASHTERDLRLRAAQELKDEAAALEHEERLEAALRKRAAQLGMNVEVLRMMGVTGEMALAELDSAKNEQSPVPQLNRPALRPSTQQRGTRARISVDMQGLGYIGRYAMAQQVGSAVLQADQVPGGVQAIEARARRAQRAADQAERATRFGLPQPDHTPAGVPIGGAWLARFAVPSGDAVRQAVVRAIAHQRPGPVPVEHAHRQLADMVLAALPYDMRTALGTLRAHALTVSEPATHVGLQAQPSIHLITEAVRQQVSSLLLESCIIMPGSSASEADASSADAWEQLSESSASAASSSGSSLSARSDTVLQSPDSMWETMPPVLPFRDTREPYTVAADAARRASSAAASTRTLRPSMVHNAGRAFHLAGVGAPEEGFIERVALPQLVATQAPPYAAAAGGFQGSEASVAASPLRAHSGRPSSAPQHTVLPTAVRRRRRKSRRRRVRARRVSASTEQQQQQQADHDSDTARWRESQRMYRAESKRTLRRRARTPLPERVPQISGRTYRRLTARQRADIPQLALQDAAAQPAWRISSAQLEETVALVTDQVMQAAMEQPSIEPIHPPLYKDEPWSAREVLAANSPRWMAKADASDSSEWEAEVRQRIAGPRSVHRLGPHS